MNAPRTSSQAAQRAQRAWLRLLAVVLAVLALALGGGLLAACGGEDEGDEGTDATGVELQTTTPPADGLVDEITWNLGFGEPTTIDPHKAGDYGPCFVASQLHDTLVRYTPDWELGPGIAESWEQVDDLTLVYTIRQDAKFWDGSQVTADDVLFSLERSADWDTGSIWADFFANVESMEKTGPWEVTVRFSVPDELFNKEMATSGGGGIVKKDYVEEVGHEAYGAGTTVMGSGPYKVVEWRPGDQITLEANPDYWDPNLVPKVAKVNLTFISETSTITSAILSGEIDGSYEVPATSVPALEGAPGTVYFGPSLTAVSVMAAHADGLAGDPDVRKALSMAIDRQSIVDTVFNGHAVINKTLTPPSAWDPEAIDIYEAAYAEIPGDEPDIEGAKALLEGKEGLDQPLVMAMAAGDEPELRVSSIVQQAAKDIGLTIELKPLQAMDMANVFYVPEYREGLDLVMTWGWLDIPDPLDYTVLSVMETSYFNWTGYSNPEMEALLNEARQTFDPATRAGLVVEAQEMYTADTVVIPLVNPHQFLYMSDRISGAPCSFAYMWIPGLAMIGGTE